ncbi:MAG: uracil-DNA glycosylase [Pacificimonas sp.]
MESEAVLTPALAAAALEWLIDSGADALVDEAAGTWLKPQFSLPSSEEPAKGLSPNDRPRNARQKRPAQVAARNPAFPTTLTAHTLDDLRAEAKAYPLSLRADNKSLVFADGNPDADIMVIGEAPGAQEEREGKPFVGPAGQLLDKMLAAIKLDRNSVYITNLSPWRPAQNRTPSAPEAAECLPLLHRHIAIVKPKLILTVGGTSAKALLATEAGIMRLRGKWRDIEVEGEIYPVLPTFHPAFLMRQPEQKRLAWQDLLTFRKRATDLTAA